MPTARKGSSGLASVSPSKGSGTDRTRILLGVVDEDLVAQVTAFAALADDADRRLIHDRAARPGAVGAHQPHAVQGGGGEALVRRQDLHQVGHLLLQRRRCAGAVTGLSQVRI